MGVAYRFIADSGEQIVHLIPNDGRGYYINGERKKISLALRTGIWQAAFPAVLAYKEKWDADRAAREQKSWDDAQAAEGRLRQTEGGRTGWPNSSPDRTPPSRNAQRNRPSVTPHWTPPATRKSYCS